MATVALAALLRSRPDGPLDARDWLEEMLSRHWRRYSATDEEGDRVRGWSVGTVVGTETLVQARPIQRTSDGGFLDDLLRTPAPCIIAAHAAASAARGEGPRLPPLRMSRFQRWIGVWAEGDLSSEGTNTSLADALRADLPDFLARSQVERSDRELAFFTFLAALHADGALGSTYARPEEIRQALVTLDERLGHRKRINVLVTDGRTLGVLHRGGTLVALEPPRSAVRRRRGRGEDDERPAASLLVFDPHDPLSAPVGGGERIADGVFTVSPGRPTTIERT